MSHTREQPESKLRKKVKADVKQIPCSWFVKIQQVAIRGVPDFLGVICGRFVALELKKDEQSKPTKLQIFVMNKIKKAGGIVMVVTPDSWPEQFKELQGLVKKSL